MFKICVLFILLGFLNCQLTSNKTKKNSPADFKSFFQNFNKDSIFQKSSITFPLIVLSDSVVIRKIEKEEWVFTPLLSGEKHNVKIGPIYNDTIIVNYSFEDTGIFVDHYFTRMDGQWSLVKIVDLSD